MAAGDLYRDRRGRHRRVRAHRPSSAANATRARRDRESRHPRRPLRRVLGDPRGGRRLGFRAPPRPVPDRTPDGVRVHRRTGRPAARRSRPEGAFPAHRDRLLRGIPARRPARHPASRPPRVDRAPTARRDGCAARVPRPPARDRTALPGGARGARGELAGRRPAVRADRFRVRPRPPPARLPGPVGDGLAVASTSSSSTARRRTTAETT